MRHAFCCVLATAVSCCAATAALAEPAAIQFSRDIRPILSDKCFYCHGPDKENRQADVQLDTREGALADLGGYAAIVPGKPDESEALRRIFSDDEDERMPPVDSGKSLTAKEKELLRQWVAEGAPWQGHWSFEPPQAAAPPAVKQAAWPRNPIDHFILARLEHEGLQPTAEADRPTLIRRLALDLTGLPPTPAEVEAFVNDKDPAAYEKLVDRLLASPRYGERMALLWLDAARYADTDGFQVDFPRTMWPWRDWVIRAYNDNMPFDQFTVEQIAGDMLPDATVDQKLASAFNRNHRINAEAGALPEEYQVEYVIDRVETTSTVWLGLTVGCARCHDHKFDPISQKNFYQMFAYFNGIAERGNDRGASAAPNIKYQSPADLAEIATLEGQIAAQQQRIASATQAAAAAQKQWEQEQLAKLAENKKAVGGWIVAEPLEVVSTGGAKFVAQADGSYLATGPNPSRDHYTVTIAPPLDQVTGVELSALVDPTHTKQYGYSRSVNGNYVMTSFEVEAVDAQGRATPVKIAKAEANYSQPGYPIESTINAAGKTGWAAAEGPENQPRSALYVFEKPLAVVEGMRLKVHLKFESPFAHHQIGRFQLRLTPDAAPQLDAATSIAGLPAPVVAALKTPAEKRTAEQAKSLASQFAASRPEVAKLTETLAAQQKQLAQLKARGVSVMVMQEMPKPRPTYLLNRGQYNQPDKSAELSPGVPARLAPEGMTPPANRLELARWLVSDKNPLTARVVMNRFWQMHFGTGIVKTTEDFGAQGEWPVHPELLDWLAVEFQRSGWDMKAMHKLIVTSAAYRQASRTTPALTEKDPENRLLARGPRHRLTGEAIRDQALWAAGLLNEEIGGPPVKPYQPAGLWSAVASGPNEGYPQDRGEKLYRRSMYTFWKRAVAPVQMTIFDAAGREMCNVRARVTNTPLQALVLMNDVTFVEAARKLAERMLREGGADPAAQTAYGYRLLTGRKPSEATARVLADNHTFFLTHYRAQPAAAEALLKIGEAPRDAQLDVVETAAMTATAHLLLNLDEVITQE